MKVVCTLLALCFAYATAVPTKIVDGSVTRNQQYSTIVSLLNSWDGCTFRQICMGTIINTRSILTVAHCTIQEVPARWRVRVGSRWANSGGVVHSIAAIINHPDYNQLPVYDSDISILRTASVISYVNNVVQPGTFAGPNYSTRDGEIVWAAGFGRIAEVGTTYEQLRLRQMWTVSQQTCRLSYGSFPLSITDNMLCFGWPDVAWPGRGHCHQESGAPLYHNGVVIGVWSFGIGCASPEYPGVNTRLSRFSNWIQANA